MLDPHTWMLPIHLADQDGHCDALALILEAGADINSQTRGVRTVLKHSHA
jgi:hypothetical protein